MFEDIADVLGEGLDIFLKVGRDMILIAHELFQIERRGIIKALF